MALQIGERLLKKYQIERLIGEGGFGYVYEATDLLLHRRVAIKQLKSDAVANPEAVQRFAREGQVASATNHPNIVTTYSLEMSHGAYFLVMELLDGGNLADLLRQRHTLSPNEAINLTLAILAALGAVHARGIVHRDIKPSNILFSREGVVKLGDFGVAHIPVPGYSSLTQTGMIFGTIRYMSPEQARGEPTDARSDLYAVGAVLYEMLAGHAYLNFDDNVFQNLELVKTQSPLPLPPTAPRWLEAVVMRALAKSRAARFQNASEIAQALRSGDGTATLVKPIPAPPVSRPRQAETNSTAMLLAALMTIIILLLFVMLALVASSRPTPAPLTSGGIAVPTGTAIPIVTVAPTTRLASATIPVPTVAMIPTSVAKVATSTPTNAPTRAPTPAPTIPKGEIIYEVPLGGNLATFMYSLGIANDPHFYDRHAEIWCTPRPPLNPTCMKGGTNLILKWEELNPAVGLPAAQGQPGKMLWLALNVNDEVLRTRGLENLVPHRGNAVLVRGMWRDGVWLDDPVVNVMFVWYPQSNRYGQVGRVPPVATPMPEREPPRGIEIEPQEPPKPEPPKPEPPKPPPPEP